MMLIDRGECPGGYEVKVLLTELDRELLRAAVMVVGVLIIFLIIYLI